ncbi:carbohydrate esterase [Flavobacterium sp. Sd200]|uniref:rhamnogalacturonan acetylesterase n=1 Tax=Flavobacterium sp. Sd200 TaxID=2692211 RepID=UPI00136A902D|nr:rhamnogalacturonan acetylesterase [Flavobacterium sp. Sd200]MXN90854.1 carbohydrate esterase [Flavobacterium sp. Sd200]
MNFIKVFALLIFTTAILAPEKPATTGIWMIGDSTMAPKSKNAFPELGWGEGLRKLVNDKATVHNHAVNGRSTLSFINENRWKAVCDSIKPGDYVIIQFGHNDQKPNPDRHTEPFTSYKDNLKKFITETREHKGTPILCSSIVRRHFDGKGNLIDSHGDYIKAAKEVATETKTMYVDMESLTRNLVGGMGPKESKSLFLFTDKKQDSTHLNVQGAERVAKLFVDDCKKVKAPIAKLFK